MSKQYSIDDDVLIQEALKQVAALKEASQELCDFRDMYFSTSFASDPMAGGMGGWWGGFDGQSSWGQAFQRPSATAAVYIQPTQLQMLRAHSRAFCATNPYWKAVEKNRIAYNVGTGHVYSIVPREAGETLDKKTRRDAKRELDLFIKTNKYRTRQGEKLTRLDRDGEFFLRMFDNRDDGILRVRFVEPLAVQNPPDHGPENGTWFGIQFSEFDYEEPIGYFIRPLNYDGGTLDDRQMAAWNTPVPAENIQHRKANVDMSSPRGLPSTYALAPRLEQALSTLKSMGRLVDIRARIALIRKQVNATLNTIQPLLLRNRSGQGQGAGGVSRNAFQLPYGAIFDTNDQRNYEFPNQNIETDKIVHSVKADLQSVAAAVGFADFVISADSTSNFAGALVKEGPMDKAVGCSQQDLIDDDIEVFERALQVAADNGRLPKDILEQVQIKVEPPKIIARNAIQEAQAAEIYNRLGAESTETVSEKAGFDWDTEDARLKANPTAIQRQTDMNLQLAKAGLKAGGGGGSALDNKRSHQAPAYGKSTARAIAPGDDVTRGEINQRAEESLLAEIGSLREAWLKDPTPEAQQAMYAAEDRLVTIRESMVVPLQESCDEQHVLSDIPDIRQTDHYSCGAAASEVVGRHFGVGPKTLEEWKTALGTTEEKSTSPQAIIGYFTKLGLRVSAQSNMTVDDLSACIAQGMPVIVPLQDYDSVRSAKAQWNYGHYLCAIGVIGSAPNRFIIAQDSSAENADHVPGGDVTSGDNVGNIASLGRILVDEKTWCDAWHDIGEDGAVYQSFGIAVGGVARPIIEQPKESLLEHASDPHTSKPSAEDIAMFNALVTAEWDAKTKAEILALPHTEKPMNPANLSYFEDGVKGTYLGTVDSQQVFAVDMAAWSAKHGTPRLPVAGNSTHLPCVPTDKILVDWSFTCMDRSAECYHDVVEYLLENKWKWSHSRACRMANWLAAAWGSELRPELQSLAGAA